MSAFAIIAIDLGLRDTVQSAEIIADDRVVCSTTQYFRLVGGVFTDVLLESCPVAMVWRQGLSLPDHFDMNKVPPISSRSTLSSEVVSFVRTWNSARRLVALVTTSALRILKLGLMIWVAWRRGSKACLYLGYGLIRRLALSDSREAVIWIGARVGGSPAGCEGQLHQAKVRMAMMEREKLSGCERAGQGFTGDNNFAIFELIKARKVPHIFDACLASEGEIVEIECANQAR